MNPLLKWVGGKRWQLPLLRLYYNRDRRLVEPFCGGLSIALGLEPKLALLNDINPHLINFYKQVQHGVPIDTGHPPQADTYYEMRDTFNCLVRDHVSAPNTEAMLFFALNHWGFNGLWRVNKSGLCNVPPRPVLRPLPTPPWHEYTEKFNHWMFTCSDFERLNLCSTDFVYCDPPYHETYSGYDAAGFNLGDHVRLFNWVRKHPGPACICNAMTPQMTSLYEDGGWNWVELESRQQMQASRGRVDRVPEILAFNEQFAIDRSRACTHDRQEITQ